MAKTLSTMLPLGSLAPDFFLPDVVSGKQLSLATFSDKKALLVIFLCRHCPYVKHVMAELRRLGDDFLPRQVAVLGISSNDAKSYPEDSPASLKAMVKEEGFSFPICFDETQQVAKAYQAACTPEFYLFDQGRKLVYRGQLDDSRPGNGLPVTGESLRAAMEALLSGRPVSADQKPSIGCNIKWKPNNAPPYFG